MLKNWNWLSAMSAVCVLSVSAPDNAAAQDTPPFGDADNVSYAAEVWSQMDGHQSWKLSTPVYKGGQSPRQVPAHILVRCHGGRDRQTHHRQRESRWTRCFSEGSH